MAGKFLNISSPIKFSMRQFFTFIYRAAVETIALLWRFRIAVGLLLLRPLDARFLARSGHQSPKLRSELAQFGQLPGKTIWIHAVSLGEAKAASGLINLCIERLGDVKFALSTTTKTGYEEMGRLSAGKKAVVFYLPVDTPRHWRRLIDQLDPKLMVFMESDVWLNFLKCLKKKGVFTAVANARISDSSYKRLRIIPSFTSMYFENLDLICPQSESIKKRFVELGASENRLIATGNLKLSNAPAPADLNFTEQLKKKMGWREGLKVIALASTHEDEELLLIKSLWPLMLKDPDLRLLIVPRHPNRCEALAKQIARAFGPVTLQNSSATQDRDISSRMHMVNLTGHLMDCYRLSEVAIVGGSFKQELEGHNIFEPISVEVPPLFGPYMNSQLDFVRLAKEFHAGIQVSNKDLCAQVEQLLQDREKLEVLKSGCRTAVAKNQGALDSTWNALMGRGAFRTFKLKVPN